MTLSVCEARHPNPRTTTSSEWSSNSKIKNSNRRLKILVIIVARVGISPVEKLWVNRITVIQCLLRPRAAIKLCTKQSQRILPRGPSLWRAVKIRLGDPLRWSRLANSSNCSNRRDRGPHRALEPLLWQIQLAGITKISTKGSPNSWRPSKIWVTRTTRMDRVASSLALRISPSCTRGPNLSCLVSTWIQGPIWTISCTCLTTHCSRPQDQAREGD